MKKSQTTAKKVKQKHTAADGQKEIPKYKQEEKIQEANLHLKNSGPLAQKQFKKKM